MKNILLLLCASLVAFGSAVQADDVIERTGRDSIAIKPATVAIPGAVSVGTLSVSGTSYGGSIQATAFVSPTITGTMAGNLVRSGTTTGGTIVAPVLSGTSTGTAVHNGTNTFSGVTRITTTGTATPVLGQIAVSGTNLIFYNGTGWVQLDNAE